MYRSFSVALLLATAVFSSSDAPKSFKTAKDKAAFADPAIVAFVRPGLVITITGASIASGGTISANFTVTDPKGLPLELNDITTPGTITASWVASYIPKGGSYYIALTTATQTSPITGNSANQPAADRGGTISGNASSGYTYTFGTKVPAGFDTSQTVRIGVYASRNLTDFGLGTNYADYVFTFVPNGSPITDTHNVIATQDCNRCHDPLAAHGGSRRLVALCVMCHNPGGNGVQTVDPDTGNSIDFEVMIHKIHMGSSLPSVVAGTPYIIIGFRQGVNDFSDVVFPADARNCQMCHEPGAYPRQSTVGIAGASGGLPPAPLNATDDTITGGSVNTDTTAPPPLPGTGDPTVGPRGATVIPVSAAQDPGQSFEPAPTDKNWWLTRPNTAACGACHDNVNFQTGENHDGGLPATDSQCPQCHFIQGEIPFDASILGAHTIPQWTPGLMPGVNFKLLSVTGAAGSAPTVTFSITDNAGNPIAPSSMDSLSLVMAGPTADYASVVSETATGATSAGTPGTYTYKFKTAIPANATGTYTMGIEGYRNYTILPGTVVSQTVRDVGFNQLYPFSVDGSTVAPHPVEVVRQNCDACHYRISAHGGFRVNVQYCLLCHNPNATDAAVRPASANPPQGIDFPVLIHRLHEGAQAEEGGQMTPFIVYGFRSSVNDFSDVRYPAALQDCGKCHVNASDFPPVPDTRISVNNPRDFINPTPPTIAACTACHTAQDASAHAAQQTNPSLGESCGVCHGQGAAFGVDVVHARSL